MLLMLILGAAGAWAETKTIEINTANSGVNGTYADKTFTVDNVAFGFTQWMKSTNIQAKKSTTNSCYNVDAIPGVITKVTVVQTGTARAITMYGGTSSKPTTKMTSPATAATMVFDCTGQKYTYFSMTTPANAVYINTITIEYEVGEGSDMGGGSTPATYSVNVASNIENGTVTASPTTASEGETITLTATPETGYLLGAWNVKYANKNTTINVANSKFTMPADDVNVSASFMKVEPGKAVLSKDTYEAWGANDYLANEGSVTYDVITLSAKGTNTDGPVRFNVNSYMQFYSGTTATFTAASGYKITKIVFNCTTESGNYSPEKLTTPDGSYNIEGKEGTWTGNASSVTFTARAQCRANSVTITYAEDNGEVTPPTPKTFALTYASNDKGACSATVDGTSVKSGDMVEAGKTVALSCTPNEGYTFDSWNVRGTESSNTIEVSSENTFIMPEEAVTVDAKYAEVPAGDDDTNVITYNFNDKNAYPEGFPETTGTKATTPQTFVIGGHPIIVSAPDAYYIINAKTDASRGLFFGKSTTSNGKPKDGTAYLGFPAIKGKKLTKVEATTTSGVAGSVKVNIYNASWAEKSESVTTVSNTKDTFTFNLTGTAANTEYRLAAGTTGKNLQFDNIVLTYVDSDDEGEEGGDTPTTVTTIPNFIKSTTLSLAVGDEKYDVRECLNIPADYDTSAYAITTTINGETQKDGEFACIYPWLVFQKAGTYTVHVVAAAVEGKYLQTEGDITVTVTGGETPESEKVYASIAELIADGAPVKEARNVTVTLKDEEIIGIYRVNNDQYRNGIFFKSGEQQVLLYFRNVPEEWVKGGHVSGTLTNCPWKLYSTNWELCPETGWAWSELTYVAPPVVELANVSISGEPTTKDYYTGESFDLAGLTVTANYSDGSSTDVTKKVDWTVSPEVFTAEGKVAVKVTATYEEKTSEEMTYTVTVTKNPYVIAQNFTETSGNIDENISYEAFKGNAANDPISPKDSGYIRLYQNGGYITISGAKGVTISEVILTTGSTYASTTIGTAIDDAEIPTEGTEVAKNSDFKVSGLNCNSISFYCLGTDKDHRIDVATIKVKYTKKDISLTEIAISGEGVGKEFIQYAEFDHEGVAVTAKYSDGSSTDVTNKTEFTAPDMTTTGEKTVAVSYTEGGVTKTSSYTINVISETVEAIHIAATGKTLFRLGESFSSEGLSVTADYNSGRKGIELETDQYTVVAPEMETLGKKEVTVTLVADEEITVSYAVNIVPANTIFYESFDTNDGTGGNDVQWNGSIASNNIKSDNTWTFTSASGANQCAKFGAGSTAGSAVTPALGHEGSVTVSFKAAAWDGSNEKTDITVSIDGDDTSVQTIELTKGEWNDYTVTLNGLTAESKVKFAASQSSNNRFFLDEVLISEATEPDATVCVVTNYIEALKKGEAGYTLDGLEAIINGILMKK